MPWMFDCTIREKKKEKKMYTLSKSLILILANNSADFNNTFSLHCWSSTDLGESGHHLHYIECAHSQLTQKLVTTYCLKEQCFILGFKAARLKYWIPIDTELLGAIFMNSFQTNGTNR